MLAAVGLNHAPEAGPLFGYPSTLCSGLLDATLVLPHNSPDIDDALYPPLNGDISHVTRWPAEFQFEGALPVAASAVQPRASGVSRLERSLPTQSYGLTIALGMYVLAQADFDGARDYS